MKYLKKTLVAGIAAAALCVSASASALVINLTTEFSGGSTPQGTSPYVTINITQGADASTVQVDVTNNLVGTEFISELYLNFNTSLGAIALAPTSNPGGTPPSNVVPASFTLGDNCCKADGDGFFDIQVGYATGANDNRFGAGETSRFLLSFATAITPNDFNFISVGGPVGKTGFLGAAHVQSIACPAGTTSCAGSGFIGNNGGGPPSDIPEPGTLALIGLALAGIGLARRRR